MLDARPADAAPNVLLVYPKFSNTSFWNYLETCELVGAKYPAPPLGLVTVAAMLPADWPVRLVDCNAAPLTDRGSGLGRRGHVLRHDHPAA